MTVSVIATARTAGIPANDSSAASNPAMPTPMPATKNRSVAATPV